MIRKFQRQDLEAAVKIWLAANKEAHDFIEIILPSLIQRTVIIKKCAFAV